MMNIKSKIVKVLKYVSHFIITYTIVSFFMFFVVGLQNFYFYDNKEFLTNSNFIKFLNTNVNIFILFSLYITLVVNVRTITISLPYKINFKLRNFFLKYNFEQRNMFNDLLYYAFIIITLSVVPIQSYYNYDIMYQNEIYLLLIMFSSLSILLIPIIMDDYDSSLYHLDKYLKTKDLKDIKTSFRFINKIFEKLINTKAIYQILQYISANDIIGKIEHLEHLQSLYSSLKERNSVLVYDDFFNLFKISSHKKELHIVDILTDVKLPFKTRIKDFITMNWKYLIPPSIIVGWLLNKM